MLNPTLPFVAEKVEAQTVALEVCELEEFGAEMDPLVVLQETLEDGVLHTLAVVEAGFGDAAEASLAIGGRGRDIVADDHEHGGLGTWSYGCAYRHSKGG